MTTSGAPKEASYEAPVRKSVVTLSNVHEILITDEY